MDNNIDDTLKVKREMESKIASLTLYNIASWAHIIHQNATNKGFHDQHRDNDADFINYQLMNLMREVTELHDAWRSGDLREPCDKADKMLAMGLPALTCMEEEYADIIIRALDQCRRLRVDIGRAMAVKHLYNMSRPHMHGGKKS